jgi:hypothetical protein
VKKSGIFWKMWAVAFVASWTSSITADEENGDKPAVAVVVLERVEGHAWTLPNGKTLDGGWGMSKTVKAGDPEAVETVKRHHEEMKELIAQKKGYKLIKAYGQEKTGGKLYKYRFTFADGSQEIKEFGIPLNNVESWDDFLQKRQEEEDNRHEQINQAIEAGKFKLKHVETRYTFTCRDAGSEEKYRVRFLPLSKGKQYALITPLDPDDKKSKISQSHTTWLEHLQAVRKKDREVLSEDIKKTYYYEMVLKYGSKTYFPTSELLK